jgi:hypothetical protein
MLILATIRGIPDTPAYLSPIDGREDRWLATQPNGRYSRHSDGDISDSRVIYDPTERTRKVSA